MPYGRSGTGQGTTRRCAVAGALLALLVSGSGLVACQAGSPDRAGPSTEARHPSASGRPSPTSAWDRSPDSIAAVGDSLTTAFDTCSLLAECPKASWATGTDPDVDSLARRLLADPAGDSWNLAESGARMADLAGQMKRAAAHHPELVTVMAGGNDACRPTVAAMTPVADFRAAFEEALGTLRREAPEAQVYVASVPDLKRLWSVGKNHPMSREAWKFGICQSMLRAPMATGEAAVERRGDVRDRVQAYNRALEGVCAGFRACRYDDGAVFGHRFTAEDLSRWDWFHPSRKGQHELAELAYRQITAP